MAYANRYVPCQVAAIQGDNIRTSMADKKKMIKVKGYVYDAETRTVKTHTTIIPEPSEEPKNIVIENPVFCLMDRISPSDCIDDKDKEDDNHRLTIRIPKLLLDQIDIKRKQRVGKISRNLWILETIEKACKE